MSDTVDLTEAQTVIRLNAALVDEARDHLQHAVDQARGQGASWARQQRARVRVGS